VKRWLAIAALLLTACADRRGSEAEAPKIELLPCHLRGVSARAKCGTLRVFEDRAAKSGRTIDLFIAVIPSLASSPEPDPVFFLAGGPGQAATDVASGLSPALERIQQTRDLVLVDQRGTGKSNPLDCELYAPDASLSEIFSADLEPDRLKTCLSKLDADPRLYTTPIAMDDLDDVRAALGYQQINIWGASYGTRAGLVYLRRHPDRARTAILDGVAPMSLVLPLNFPRDAQRALDLLFEQCAKEAACAAAHPSLEPRFSAFLERLRREPVTARVLHPRTGEPSEVRITFESFSQNLRVLLYMPEIAAMLPWIFDRADKNDFGPFVAATTAFNLAIEMHLGMQLSVMCSEDAPLLTDEAIARWTENTWLGPSSLRQVREACAVWPKGQLPANYRDPVSSNIPILLLSGELDPVTPPSWAEEAKKTLPNALSIVFSGTGHNTLGTACAHRAMIQFLKREPVDTSCANVLVSPPFFTSFAGPTP
jgi:pimeloyl-ACP methyl ester carboxylesterase